MKIKRKDIIPKKLVGIIQFISIIIVLKITHCITNNYIPLFLPLFFLLSVSLVINIIINRVKNFYSHEIVFTYESLLIALLVATFANTSLFPMLFIPFFIQLFVVILVINYKELKNFSEEQIKNRISRKHEEILNDLSNEREQDKKIIENRILIMRDEERSKYFSDYQLTRKIKNYGIASIILISISIYLVWCFPYLKEKEKEEKSNNYNKELIKKIDSLEFSVTSLKDSLSKMMNSITINRVDKQVRGTDSTQNYNSKPIPHENIK